MLQYGSLDYFIVLMSFECYSMTGLKRLQVHQFISPGPSQNCCWRWQEAWTKVVQPHCQHLQEDARRWGGLVLKCITELSSTSLLLVTCTKDAHFQFCVVVFGGI